MNGQLNLIVAQDRQPAKVGQTMIALSELEGWDDLSEIQQSYLTKFARNPLKPKTITATMGLQKSKVEDWFVTPPFNDIADLIKDIYLESYKEIDAIDAIENSKIRNRVIQSLEKGGRYSDEPKEENHQHLHITMADFLKLQNKD